MENKIGKITKKQLWLINTLVTSIFTYYLYIGYLLPGFNEILKLKPESININQVWLILTPITTYILIIWYAFLTIKILENNLKKHKEYDFINSFKYKLFIVNLYINIIIILIVVFNCFLFGQFSFILGLIYGLLLCLVFICAQVCAASILLIYILLKRK